MERRMGLDSENEDFIRDMLAVHTLYSNNHPTPTHTEQQDQKQEGGGHKHHQSTINHPHTGGGEGGGGVLAGGVGGVLNHLRDINDIGCEEEEDMDIEVIRV